MEQTKKNFIELAYKKNQEGYPLRSDTYIGQINPYYGIQEYRELESEKVNHYVQQNNEERLRQLEFTTEEIHHQIQELLKLKMEKELELSFIQKAEWIKKRNQEIATKIEEIKDAGLMNVWQHTKGRSEIEITDTIQNGTYTFKIWMRPTSSWKSGKQIGIRYYLESQPFLGTDGKSKNIQYLENEKIFRADEVEAATKYLENRKVHFQKYFNGEKPPMIQKYEELVTPYGVRLEGYRVEGE